MPQYAAIHRNITYVNILYNGAALVALVARKKQPPPGYTRTVANYHATPAVDRIIGVICDYISVSLSVSAL